MSLSDFLGWIATFLFTICYIPQIIKTAKTKTVEGLSLFFLLITLIANIIAFYYAILINQKPLQIKYIFGLIFVGICVGLYYKTIRLQKFNKSHGKDFFKSAVVVWFTGLSGSGKSTIAKAVQNELEKKGKKVFVVDGDVIRNTQHRHLGFSRDDIKENNRLIAELVKQKTGEVDFVLVPIISPFRDDRSFARNLFGKRFVEIYINCPLDLCVKRDTKGLYAKAEKGEIKNLIGVSRDNPYEVPLNPELEIRTDQFSLSQSVEKVLEYIKNIFIDL